MTAPSEAYLRVMRHIWREYPLDAKAIEGYVSFLKSGITRMEDTQQPQQAEGQPGARVPDKRLPDDGNGDEDAHNAGFNECRDLWIASLGQQPAQGDKS